MINEIKIKLVGDYSNEKRAHIAIPNALKYASDSLNVVCNYEWIGTEEAAHSLDKVKSGDGIWVVPGSPYVSMDGALNAIKYARENNIPFFGSCAGFQHTVIEYARNVLNIKEADHEESNPDASVKIISLLSCSMKGAVSTITLVEGTRAAGIYNKNVVEEGYNCNYGFNMLFEKLFYNCDFRIAGRDENNEIKIIEHKTHPFMMAVLFQPELSSFKNVVHPLIMSYLSAVIYNKK